VQLINFEFNGPRTMRVPDGDIYLSCAQDIIEGRSYPLPPKNDWLVRCVVDLGAHAGEFTLMAGIRWPEAKIVAYEPQPDLAELCRENCEHNGVPVEVHAQAVSDSSGTLPLYYSEIGSVASSLCTGTGRDGQEATACQLVEVVDIKDVLTKCSPDVLKLDVEGVELLILQRIDPDFLGIIPYIYAEFHQEYIRLEIERMLLPTHELSYARIPCARQGEVLYTRRK